MKKLIPQPIKNIYHLLQAMLANFMYGFPSKSIKVIGVTGTNGKTTTVQMITKILEEAGFRVAMASTINFKLAEKEWVNQSKFTTLSSFQVQKFILDAVKAGCKYLVLETSSHSLDQYRVWGVKYGTAVITNITREHLDYHETMEEYRRAKTKLFRKAKTAVVNLSMDDPDDFLKFNNKVKYGYILENQKSKIKNQNDNAKFKIIEAKEINLGTQDTKFKIKDTDFKLNLIGEFNVENALAATCVGLAENINLEISAKALEKIQGIPGRMEYVPNEKGLNIIVDFALTPDALEKLYSLLNQIKKNLPLEKGEVRPARNATHSVAGGRAEGFLLESVAKIKIPPTPLYKGGESKIIAVFGSCGERDRGKRPLMGEIVASYTDYIIITNEDPFYEDPAQIISEVAAGVPLCHPERSLAESKDLMNKHEIPQQARDDFFCKTENVNFWIIADRREAIKKALQLAKPGDFVVVTGKGHEDTMSVGDEKIPWNDRKVILEELEKVGLKTNY